jgi:hypothetical protein
MAKLLSTFSKTEMSRFEAFKRVSFPCDAISRYVAHCLAERQQPQRQRYHPQTTKKLAFGVGSDVVEPPPRLEDLVVPGQDEEITTVVATLAKAYAQRLCAAAKVLQQQQQSTEQDRSINNAVAGVVVDGTHPDDSPIQPEHILQAFYARQQQGQDPGFFLQPHEGFTPTQDTAMKEKMKRAAALAAQEEFDRCFAEYKEVDEKKRPSESQPSPSDDDNKKEKESKDVVMAVTVESERNDDNDSDSGDEEEIDLGMEVEKETS